MKFACGDRLQLLSPAQILTLPGRRLLVRHRGGMSLLAGIELHDLRRILALVDGNRRVSDICADLDSEFESEDVAQILNNLANEVVGAVGDRDSFPAPRGPELKSARDSHVPEPVLILGNGDLARGMAQALRKLGFAKVSQVDLGPMAGFTDPDFAALHHECSWSARSNWHHRVRQDWGTGDSVIEPTQEACEQPDWASNGFLSPMLGQQFGLVICALEEVPLQAALSLQAACLGAGVPSLFLLCWPEGVWSGPVCLPGRSACLFCGQIQTHWLARLTPDQCMKLAAHWELKAIAEYDQGPLIIERIGREISACLMAGGSAGLLTQFLNFTSSGQPKSYPLMLQSDCPLCGAFQQRFAESGEQRDQSCQAARLGARLDWERTRQFESSPQPRISGGCSSGDGTRTVGILGGGTAGYLTALALRKKLPDLEVTLIESSAVPVIGVGEATTPLMPQFLHLDLGLDIHEFFREVLPTIKLGIQFNWGEGDSGNFNYPFGPVRVLEPLSYEGNMVGISPRSLWMDGNKVPLVRRENGRLEARFGAATAYHLENRRFVGYLRHQAQRLGIPLVDAKVSSVVRDENGEKVTALIAADGRRFSFDLYVDCSGFQSLLLEQSLGSPFLGFESSLFTDRAIVAAVPHGGQIKPYTLAQSQSAGWCWNTPQVEADHRGYVFASAFQREADAVAEMREFNPGMGDYRLIRFRPGRHQHFWKGNVVAMGNAYGFVEPLESTALHLLIRQIGLLVQALPVRGDGPAAAAILNRKVGGFWDYLRWFLAIHFKFNQKRDTPFWRACREHIDVSQFGELIESFLERGPLTYDQLARATFDYPDPLWGAAGIDILLAGQGVRGFLPRPAMTEFEWRHLVAGWRESRKSALGQAEALAAMAVDSSLLEDFLAAFRAIGPAFGRVAGDARARGEK